MHPKCVLLHLCCISNMYYDIRMHVCMYACMVATEQQQWIEKSFRYVAI